MKMNQSANWRTFPQFEKSLAGDTAQLMVRVESTCRQLDEFARSGSVEQQRRAYAALAAYVGLLELIRLINVQATSQAETR
jgi:hypothetical protein